MLSQKQNRRGRNGYARFLAQNCTSGMQICPYLTWSSDFLWLFRGHGQLSVIGPSRLETTFLELVAPPAANLSSDSLLGFRLDSLQNSHCTTILFSSDRRRIPWEIPPWRYRSSYITLDRLFCRLVFFCLYDRLHGRKDYVQHGKHLASS